MKKVNPYLESGHQDAHAYVVKSEKSIVDMLIVDMRNRVNQINLH